MSTRHIFALIVALSTASQIGCCGMQNSGGGCAGQVFGSGYPSCGVADAACGCPEASCSCPDASCGCPDASCGCPEASCSCPDVSCGCPDASCGCPESCASGVGCGSPVVGGCRLLQRMRNALRGGSSGCSSPAYYSEWQDSPPCNCESCDSYGNHTGGPYASPHGRRANLAKRRINLKDELHFSEKSGTTYR